MNVDMLKSTLQEWMSSAVEVKSVVCCFFLTRTGQELVQGGVASGTYLLYQQSLQPRFLSDAASMLYFSLLAVTRGRKRK